MSFNTEKQQLQQLLNQIQDGTIQLPDFQRGWVWDDKHVRDLLASVSKEFPIGAVMMLETGNPTVRFKPRPVEGVLLASHSKEPDRLILDGQQRLTSLYQSIMLKQAVTTKDLRGKEIKRWYYIDILKALDPKVDREDAIISIPEDHKVKNFRGEIIADYSTVEKQCEAELFPLSLLFDVAGLTTWQLKYIQFIPEKLQERANRWNELVQNVIQKMQMYSIPVISLYKNTPKEAVCQVFEKVNTGGVSLNVFELLTATFASDEFNLREDWYGIDGSDGRTPKEGREKRLKKLPILQTLENTDFLQAMALLVTQEQRKKAIDNGVAPDRAPGISCKRKDILELDSEKYIYYADKVTEGFIKAAHLLRSEKIFNARDLPYRTQLIPLAAVMASLGEKADVEGVKKNLKRWYWCGVLGELYGGATESRLAKDLPEILNWLAGGTEPDTITAANFIPTRLYTLRTRTSAAYKGIHALLLRDGAVDFRTGTTIDDQVYYDQRVDIHHIFPQAWCKSQNINVGQYDCIINKTPIDAKTNRIISGNAPGNYLGRVEKEAKLSSDELDKILNTHNIDSKALRNNDFQEFFKARERALLNKIERAMGKPIIQELAQVDVDSVEELSDVEEVA